MQASKIAGLLESDSEPFSESSLDGVKRNPGMIMAPASPLVDKDSREIGDSTINTNRKVMPVRPNVSVQSSESISADINVKGQDHAKPDMYSELVKLDDLRKRGIISEAEFQTQKAKLLSNN